MDSLYFNQNNLEVRLEESDGYWYIFISLLKKDLCTP